MAKEARVIPAILTDDTLALESMVRQAETFTGYVQIDIMDGQFVPSKSITWENLSSLPMKLNWEAHLMVLHPENYLRGFYQAGAQKVVFHYEATSAPREVIFQARALGLQAGLAVNPDTPLSAFTPLIDEVDSVLFLTVNPGFYGSEFIPEVIDRVVELRNAQPHLEIGVDGGIKESNILQVSRSGVDFICVGSAIFRQPQPGESFRRLQALVQQG